MPLAQRFLFGAPRFRMKLTREGGMKQQRKGIEQEKEKKKDFKTPIRHAYNFLRTLKF